MQVYVIKNTKRMKSLPGRGDANAERDGTQDDSKRAVIHDRDYRRELILAPHNVRTMAVGGNHSVGREAYVLSKYQEMGCDVVSMQETRRIDQSALYRQDT